MIIDDMSKVVEEVNKASQEIPFGNSEFQNLNFVLGSEITPERSYRHCLLRLTERLNALSDAYYTIQLENVDIEEMEDKISKWSTSKFDKKRFKIKIEQKKYNRKQTEMLVIDCLREIDTLYTAFKTFPKFNNKEFELGEREHFEKLLTRDACFNLTAPTALGQLQSLSYMKSDLKLLDETLKVDGYKTYFLKNIADNSIPSTTIK